MKKNILKTVMVLSLFVFVGSPSLFGQSASAMDEILAQESLTYGAASYLLLSAIGEVGDEADFQEAGDMMAEMQLSFAGSSSGETLDLGEYSFLLMKVFDRSGGLMYTIFPSPRYAVRELAFLEVVQGDSYPNADLSGQRAVRILERFLQVTGASTGGEV